MRYQLSTRAELMDYAQSEPRSGSASMAALGGVSPTMQWTQGQGYIFDQTGSQQLRHYNHEPRTSNGNNISKGNQLYPTNQDTYLTAEWATHRQLGGIGEFSVEVLDEHSHRLDVPGEVDECDDEEEGAAGGAVRARGDEMASWRSPSSRGSPGAARVRLLRENGKVQVRAHVQVPPPAGDTRLTTAPPPD